jgi:hypothetical protein
MWAVLQSRKCRTTLVGPSLASSQRGIRQRTRYSDETLARKREWASTLRGALGEKVALGDLAATLAAVDILERNLMADVDDRGAQDSGGVIMALTVDALARRPI